MKKDKRAELLQDTLEMLFLPLLQSGPLNGWDMMQRIRLISGEVIKVGPGSLYPALHRLEARRLVAAVWDASENNRRAKFYKLTAAGQKRLEAERETWERYTGAVASILRNA